MKIAVIAVAALLTGCATCERHPVECGAAVGILATSLALSLNQPGNHRTSLAPTISTIQPPNCASNPAMCN